MLGRPEQWQSFISWLWDYGNNRLIYQAAIRARIKGTLSLGILMRMTYTNLCIASRRPSKPQISSDASTTTLNQQDAPRKQPLGLTLHRPLRPKMFKVQILKRKGKINPSDLDLSSLTLADIEGEVGGDQTLQEKDPNGRIATASPNAVESVPGVKIADGDVRMDGAE